MHGTEPTWELFLEAFPTIYRDPILTALLAGAVLGFLGVYVVTRRMVFISAALSQVSGAGVALAFLIPMYFGDVGILTEPIAWALSLSVAATFLFRLDPARLGLTRDALLGMTYVLAGAVAVIVGSRISQEAHDISSILFGTAVAVRGLDLWLTLIVGGGLLLLHVVLVRGVALVCFDPVAARVQGLPVAALDLFLFFSIAVAVAITTRALGALPVFAFTVLPAMGALAVSRHLGRALVLATATGAASGALGYVYSFFLRFPVGASQAAVAGVFCAVFMGGRLALSKELRLPRRLSAGLAAAAAVALAVLPFRADQSGGYGAHGHGASTLTGENEDSHMERPPEQGEAPALVRTLRTSPDAAARAKAARRLGHIHATGAREPLEAALSDPDWGVRAEAAEALGHMGGKVPGVLLEASRSDESPWVREAALGALCRYAEQEPAMSAIRRASSEDDDQTVREAAGRHIQDHCPHE